MSLNTGNYEAAQRDITRKFDLGARAVTPFYPRLSMMVNSDGADEKMAFLGSMPVVREWLGDRKFHEVRAADFTVVNKDWEVSLRIPKNTIDDDRLGMYDPALEMLGRRAALHPDKLLFQYLVNGGSGVCYDGQYFFDTDHSWGASGNQSNALTYNASDHTAVTTAEFKAAFVAAVAAMLAFVDDNGEPLWEPVVEALNGLLIVVPIALRQQAYEAFNAPLSVGGAGASNVVIDRPQIVCSPRMTSSVTFDVYDVSEPIKPFVFQAREPISRQVKGAADLEEKDLKLMTKSRYAVSYGFWHKAVRTVFN